MGAFRKDFGKNHIWCIGLVLLMLGSANLPRLPPAQVSHFKDVQTIKVTQDFLSHTPISIINNSGFINQNWPGNGTENDPFVIQGYNISVTGESYGISIFNTSFYVIIENCYITGAPLSFGGIALTKVSNATIRNCIISDNDHGIYIVNGVNNSVINCTIETNHQFGIVLVSSHDCQITQNRIINNNNFAIDLSTSYHCTITQNVINNHRNGINFSEAWENVLIDNSIFNLTNDGLYLYSSSQRNELLNNSIMGCNRNGVYLQSFTAINNSFIGNRFSGNRIFHVLDDSSNTFWDNGLDIGNYWDNYSGVGGYEIPGQGESIDNYPKLLQLAPLIILHPANLSLAAGELEALLIWIAVDASPSHYSIQWNGDEVTTGNWSSWNAITFNPSLYLTLPGHYQLTLQLWDNDGEMREHIVFIQVSGVSSRLVQFWWGVAMIVLASGSTLGFIIWFRNRSKTENKKE